jgi:hypothetical protein
MRINDTPNMRHLHQALLDEGFELPDETAEVRVVMPAGGVFQLEIIQNLNHENLAKVARALTRIALEKTGEDSKQA